MPSTKLMDTEPGGEQTQYEGEASDMMAHKKETGQFGGAKTQTTSTPHEPTNTQGVSPAAKIRYGQAISEGGAGGKTEGFSGEAQQAGFGGTEAVRDESGDAEKQRREMGYGGDGDMRRDVGA